MSSVELLSFLKRNLGIIIKRLEESGVIAAPTAKDHAFRPDVEVTDAGVEIPVEGFIYSIKAKDVDIKYNIDRPVTDTDYDVAWRDTITIIARMGSKIYAKAPAGQAGRLWVKALKM